MIMVTDLLEQASLLGDESIAAVNAALSHSEWAQQKVQASRDGLAQGSNKLIGQEEWETIRAGRNTSRTLTAQQETELHRRLNEYFANPEDVVSWEDVKAHAIANLKISLPPELCGDSG
jgi:putative addiction module component (TIGR02574 family)